MLRITANRNLRVAALMAVVFKAAMWGLSMPLTKSLVDVYEPCTLGALRLVIALCVFLPILLMQGTRPLISRETVILGVTGVTLVQVFQNTGMQTVSASGSVILLFGGVVIASAVLGRVLLGESCSKLMAGALALSAVGVGIVAVNVEDRAGRGLPLLGTLLVVGAAVAFALYTVIGKRVAAADLTALNAGVLTVGLIAILPFSAREARPSLGEALDPRHMASLVILGVAVSAGSYFFWSFGLRHLPVSEASVLSSCEPVFGLLFAWLLLREGVSIWEGVGAAVIIVSCLVVALVRSKPNVETAPAPIETPATHQPCRLPA
jgi:drug/metabolite transporter (DMT)-like permease